MRCWIEGWSTKATTKIRKIKKANRELQKVEFIHSRQKKCTEHRRENYWYLAIHQQINDQGTKLKGPMSTAIFRFRFSWRLVQSDSIQRYLPNSSVPLHLSSSFVGPTFCVRVCWSQSIAISAILKLHWRKFSVHDFGCCLRVEDFQGSRMSKCYKYNPWKV